MRKTGFILGIILIFGLVQVLSLTSQTSENIVTDQSLSNEITAGTTYWYTVTDFPTLSGIDIPKLDNSISVDVTGSLVGSQLYAKVISVQQEDVLDNKTQAITSIPTIDLAIGMITTSSLFLSISNSAGTLLKEIPAGLGFPVPLIFGSTSQFNVSSIADLLLPIPIALHGDYQLQEEILNSIANSHPNISISVNSDASSLGASITGTLNDSVALDFSFTYKKSNGLLQDLDFLLTNTTTAQALTQFGIEYTSSEVTALDIEIGDEFQVMLDEYALDLVAEGFEGLENNPLATITSLSPILEAFVGSPIASLEITEINGLRYKAKVNPLAGTLGDPPEIWFSGFGTYGMGSPLNVLNISSINSRLFSIPGPFITPDWKIYEAWDKTIEFMANDGLELMRLAMSIVDSQLDNLLISSSLTTDAFIISSFEYGFNSNQLYEEEFSVSWDLVINFNQSQIGADNVTVVGWEFFNITTLGDFSSYQSYTQSGRLTQINLQSNFINFEFNYSNSTENSANLKIILNSLNILMTIVQVNDVASIVSSPTANTVSSSISNDNTPENTNEADSPVAFFPIFVTLLSLMVFRRRNT